MTFETFIVPELEDFARNWRDPKIWTEKQLWQLDRYYGRVPMARLRAILKHSIESINRKAGELGIELPREPLDPEEEP